MASTSKTPAARTSRAAPDRKAPAKSTAPAAKRPAAKRPSAPAAKAPVQAAAPIGAKAQPATNDKGAKPAKADKPSKVVDKPKKPKLVRDSFTIPKAEYEVITALKLRAAKLGQTPKKSELLRAGIKVLAAMGDPALLASLAAVPSIKTGRPAA